MGSIAENWKQVRERVAEAALRAGRNPDEIQIVAVSKTHPSEAIREAVAAGVKILGENRVQEAWGKYQELGQIAEWHLVGHLQTNKVKRALQMFDVIHSVDSLHLAQEIDRRCAQLNRTVRVLVEVKTSGEPTKFGVEPEKAQDLIFQVAELKHLVLIGLMTLGKFTSDEAEVRKCFKKLRAIREEVLREQKQSVALPHLSMGMSNDFEWAIEEGATMVRIGTAIFGERRY